MTIVIKESKTADTRTCDYTKVDRATLLASSHQHIGDVQKALRFFGQDENWTADLSDVEIFRGSRKTEMTTSYKDGVNAVDRLLREAEHIRRRIDPERLGATGFPGYPMMRPHEIPDYLKRLRYWVDEQKEHMRKAP